MCNYLFYLNLFIIIIIFRCLSFYLYIFLSILFLIFSIFSLYFFLFIIYVFIIFWPDYFSRILLCVVFWLCMYLIALH